LVIKLINKFILIWVLCLVYNYFYIKNGRQKIARHGKQIVNQYKKINNNECELTQETDPMKNRFMLYCD
jgi:predicted Holliday junction resolvase-like endonuclease